MAAHTLTLIVDLQLPDCHSLKDKRSVVRTIVDGARRRHQVAAAETGHADRWQRAELAFAAVSSSVNQLTEVLDAVERFVWSFPEVEVLDAERRWTEAG